MYKLIGIDIDGTLLKNDKTISKRTFDTIQKAKEKGTKIVLSTGRSLKGIEKYSTQLHLDDDTDFVIASSGAIIKSLGNDSIIFESSISYDEFEYLYELSKKLGITLNALSDDIILTPTLNVTTQLESFLTGSPMEIVNFDTISKDTTINRIVYINETKRFAEHILKVAKRVGMNEVTPDVYSGNEDIILDKNHLPKKLFNNFTVLKPSFGTLEIQRKGINKGSSLILLAKKLGIKPEEVIAIGDSGNDIDMIEHAGLGIAMGNAFPEVKQIADYVTSSNEEDGLANVIEKFILSKD